MIMAFGNLTLPTSPGQVHPRLAISLVQRIDPTHSTPWPLPSLRTPTSSYPPPTPRLGQKQNPKTPKSITLQPLRFTPENPNPPPGQVHPRLAISLVQRFPAASDARSALVRLLAKHAGSRAVQQLPEGAMLLAASAVGGACVLWGRCCGAGGPGREAVLWAPSVWACLLGLPRWAGAG